MKGVVSAIGRRLFSPGQRAALRMFQSEWAIARYHRAGLRQIRKQSLSRPAKLNLGSGNFCKTGFLNVDMFPGEDITLDLRLGLPFDSDCCELIFSEHCFEHIEFPEPITFLLRECFRVLRPRGELRFSVPDTAWPLIEYHDGPNSPFFKACEDHGWHPKGCTTRLEHINYHFRQDGEHRYAYDFETVEKLLKGIGFIDIRQVDFDPSLDSKHREVGSLIVSAKKPAEPVAAPDPAREAGS